MIKIKWLDKLIDKRIKEYQKGVANMPQYNPLIVSIDNRDNDRHMTRRMLENAVWYSGI